LAAVPAIGERAAHRVHHHQRQPHDEGDHGELRGGAGRLVDPDSEGEAAETGAERRDGLARTQDQEPANAAESALARHLGHTMGVLSRPVAGQAGAAAPWSKRVAGSKIRPVIDPEYEHLVTVETYSSAWEAQLDRARLEAEGIHAIVADEHFFRLYGALSNTLGGVRLQVRPGDCERASELLRNRRPILYLVTEEDASSVAEEPEEPEALVVVGRFPTPWEAHLAKALLESEGIDACVLEERLPAISLLTGEPAAEILAEVEELDEASDPHP